MKIKAKIKKLRIPRLVIESILVFGSVYLALILEADRNRDFELQNAKEILFGIQENLQIEKSRLQSLFLEKDASRKVIVLKRDSIVYASLLQKQSLPADLLQEIARGDFLNFENYNNWDESDDMATFISRYSQYNSNHDLIDSFQRYQKRKSMNRRWWNLDLVNLENIKSEVFNTHVIGRNTGEEIANFMMNSPKILNSYHDHLYRLNGRFDRAKDLFELIETIQPMIDTEVAALEDKIEGLSF